MQNKKLKYILISVIAVIFITVIIVISIKLIQDYKIKHAKIEVNLIDDLEVKFLDTVCVSDFITSINGTITDDYIIDTTSVGKKQVKFNFVNNERYTSIL